MIHIEFQIMIRNNGLEFLDDQKIRLLNEIRINGSLSSAAKQMKISYQHAWMLIDEMNKNAPSPLVVKQRGGANGGGTVISGYGAEILSEYRSIENQFKILTGKINTEINF